MITHSPDRVIDLFDDVIVLAKDSKLTGRLTYFGPIDEAKKFFERDKMEKIVLRINREEEGGEGLADEFIEKYIPPLYAHDCNDKSYLDFLAPSGDDDSEIFPHCAKTYRQLQKIKKSNNGVGGY